MRNSESGFDVKEFQISIEQETMSTVGYSFIWNFSKDSLNSAIRRDTHDPKELIY